MSTEHPTQHQPGKIFLPRNPTAEERKLFVDELNANRQAWLERKARGASENEPISSDADSTP